MLDFNLSYQPDEDAVAAQLYQVCVEYDKPTSKIRRSRGCEFPVVLALEALLRDTDKRLEAYAEGWSGEGSRKVSQKALEGYSAFLRKAFALNTELPLPHIGLEYEGNVGMFWNIGALVVDVEIDDSGTFAYAAMSGDKCVASGENIESDEMIDTINDLINQA